MRLRQAIKILKRGGMSYPNSPYSHSQARRAIMRTFHAARYVDGPRKGQRMVVFPNILDHMVRKVYTAQ